MQKKKGISLIVLVITIIVMIILAAAIILSLNNAGIIGNANKAVADSDLANLKHMASLAWAEGYTNNLRDRVDLEKYVFDYFKTNNVNIEGYGIEVTEQGVDVVKGWANSGDKIISGTKTIDIGTIINYDPTKGVTDTTKLSYTALQTSTGVTNKEYKTSDYTGKWRVIGAENGNILLVAAGEVNKLDIAVNKTYIAGVTELNNICKIYGNGYGAESARSITEKDVNRLTEWKGVYTGLLNAYGKEVTVVSKGSNVEYTINGEKVTGQFSYVENDEWKTLSAGETMTFKTDAYAYWGVNITGDETYPSLNMSKDSINFKLVFTDLEGANIRYWLADRTIWMQKNSEDVYYTTYGMYCVAFGDNGSCAVGAGASASGSGVTSVSSNNGIRPIVELQNNIVLEKQADGSYNIK